MLYSLYRTPKNNSLKLHTFRFFWPTHDNFTHFHPKSQTWDKTRKRAVYKPKKFFVLSYVNMGKLRIILLTSDIIHNSRKKKLNETPIFGLLVVYLLIYDTTYFHFFFYFPRFHAYAFFSSFIIYILGIFFTISLSKLRIFLFFLYVMSLNERKYLR